MTDTYLFLTEWQPFGFGPNAKVTFKTKETYRRNQLLKQAVSGRRRRSASTASDLMLRVRTKGTDGVLFYANTAYSELILWVRHMRANHASHTIMSRVILQRVCVCVLVIRKLGWWPLGFIVYLLHTVFLCVWHLGADLADVTSNAGCIKHQQPNILCVLTAYNCFSYEELGSWYLRPLGYLFFFSVTFTKLLPFL